MAISNTKTKSTITRQASVENGELEIGQIAALIKEIKPAKQPIKKANPSNITVV